MFCYELFLINRVRMKQIHLKVKLNLLYLIKICKKFWMLR